MIVGGKLVERNMPFWRETNNIRPVKVRSENVTAEMMIIVIFSVWWWGTEVYQEKRSQEIKEFYSGTYLNIRISHQILHS